MKHILTILVAMVALGSYASEHFLQIVSFLKRLAALSCRLIPFMKPRNRG